jgi:2-dehydropantoate 2-reductase
MNSPRIAVVGVGSIGGAIAADLLDRGNAEILLMARSPFAQLVVEHPHGTSQHALSPYTDPEAFRTDRPADWILLATKAHQSADAAPWIQKLLGPETRIAVLQNGIDQVARVQPLAPDARAVIPVTVQIPAQRLGPGHVRQQHTGALLTVADEHGQAFAAHFDNARTHAEAREDFHTQAWWKLVMNAGSGAVCALVVRDNRAEHDPEIRELALLLMREAAAVGRAEGAELPEDAPEKAMHLALAGAPGHWTSIAVDRREGRPMEWEARNAIIGKLGRKHGVPTPLSDMVTALLRVADVTWNPDA